MKNKTRNSNEDNHDISKYFLQLLKQQQDVLITGRQEKRKYHDNVFHGRRK